ncbi:MAG: beta strand repeat-containing protein, partial [Saprospiraceae bacterium]
MTRTILALCCALGAANLLAQCPTGTTVQVTNNSGTNMQGSLAFALNCLNTVPTLTTVTFNIPGSPIIQPNSLPNITKNGAIIDGLSQNGVIVDGSSPAGAPVNCFVVTAPNVTILGLTIRNFTSASGGNAILVNGNNPIIQNNTLISNRTGITTGTTVSTFSITDNTIGASGTGNISNGIFIQAATTGVVFMNEIAHNGASGINILSGTVRIRENSIYCNSTAGITRPAPPALPVINQANTSIIRGTAPANALVEVFVHSTAGCAGAPCQGKTFVGTATALATGIWTLPTPGGVPAGSMVTATSTIGSNNTSAFSTCQAVTDCSTFTASTNHTNVSCPGGSNGSATASPTGSTLSYLWNTTATTQTISNLAAGTYTVTVTNQITGCTASATAVVTQPAPLGVSFTKTNVSCFGGNNGSVTASGSGGTPGYTYVWSTGTTGPTISNRPAGTYTVTMTDANNCPIVQSTTITQPSSAVSASISKTNVSCFGGNNGSATASASGGTPGYTFVWSNGTNGPTASGLSAGTYTVTATDANGCTAAQTTTITQPPLLTANANATNATCFGGSNGTASASGSGGVTPYTIAWSTGGTGPLITGLSAGTYTATVTDGNGCTATAAATVGQPAALQIAIVASEVSCFGGNDGSATATGSGGATPYTFVWSTGTSGPTANNLSAGTYTVTMTDANTCTGSATASIAQPPGISIVISKTNVTCFGGNNGSATATATGGTPGYNFVWSTGTTGPTAINLSAGTYTVTVTDALDCTTAQATTITQPTQVGVSISKTNVPCFGGNNGSTTATANGGTPGYTYVWSNGTNGPTASGLSAGTYTATASDANGCTAIQMTTITQPPPLAASASSTGVSCFGGSNGSASASGSGGVTPYTIVWSNSATGPMAVNLPAGTYTATITDGNGCSATTTATVSSPPPLGVTASKTDESANNAKDGTATAVPSGGTPGYNYAWSNGSNSFTISNLPPGAYTVTVRDSRGCSTVATVVVNAFACAGFSAGTAGTNA